MKATAWFQLVVGAAILVTWPLLVVAGEVPQLAAGQRDIWFHLAAEAIAGLALLGAGWASLRGTSSRARLLSAFALGALLYTAVNSSGYYADLGEWAVVAAFMLLAVAATAAFAGLRSPQPRGAPAPGADRQLVG